MNTAAAYTGYQAAVGNTAAATLGGLGAATFTGAGLAATAAGIAAREALIATANRIDESDRRLIDSAACMDYSRILRARIEKIGDNQGTYPAGTPQALAALFGCAE